MTHHPKLAREYKVQYTYVHRNDESFGSDTRFVLEKQTNKTNEPTNNSDLPCNGIVIALLMISQNSF